MLQVLRQIVQGAMFQVDNAIPHRGHVVDDYVHVDSINGMYWPANSPGFEVLKLEFILKLKKSAMINCLRTRVHKQPIIALYFELENVLKFYKLEVRSQPYRDFVE